MLRWGISHGLAPPWVDGLRIAPPAAPDNRPLHALPWGAGGSIVVGWAGVVRPEAALFEPIGARGMQVLHSGGQRGGYWHQVGRGSVAV